MTKSREAYAKPLSFSTTIRNPYRMAAYLKCLAPFEGKILTHEVIIDIMIKTIAEKVYSPVYIKSKTELRIIANDLEKEFSLEQAKLIFENSPQNHKEKGFDKGWESRFDTVFKLQKEFGYIYYNKDEKLTISESGHMLLDAANECPINQEKIQNVFLNSLVKYPTSNPFRKNSNKNIPLILLLNVIELLKNDSNTNKAGVFRQELSLFICWPNNNAHELYLYIKELREAHGFNYSDELIYKKCLNLLGVDSSKENRFKMSQICGEAVDEYIRKIRSTGVISFRGCGRFLDFNMIVIDKIKYILKTYIGFPEFESEHDFYDYMGEMDAQIISIEQSVSQQSVKEIKETALVKFSKEFSNEEVSSELTKLGGIRRVASKIEMLKYISEPTRLEFLTAIVIKQRFPTIRVVPNYACDDEGYPTYTASGGMADIECYDDDYNSLVEVTLMRGRSDQINNEMIPIMRHLTEAKENVREETFSVFVAPYIHDDVNTFIEFTKFKNMKININLNIIALSITDFVASISTCEKMSSLLRERIIQPN